MKARRPISFLAVSHDSREGGEYGRLLAQGREGGDGGLEELVHEPRRGSKTEERREIGAVRVAPCVFSHPLRIAGQVEHVVGDLESESEVAREERQGNERLLPGSSREGSRPNGRHEERAGLS